jgi:hypothetical protein
MNRRHVLAALFFALPHAGLAQTTAGPADLVRRLYAFSAGKTGAWDGPSAYFDAATRKATFTAGFNAAIAEEAALLNGDMGAVDFDPISNSQDPAVHNLVITETASGAGKARVEARFRTGPEATASQSRVVYLLVMEGGQWRVDDIVPHGDDGADFPIRRALAESIAELKAAAPVKAP